MSKKILLSIPDTHCKWLESARKEKGVESIQDVVRVLIREAYEQRIKEK